MGKICTVQRSLSQITQPDTVRTTLDRVSTHALSHVADVMDTKIPIRRCTLIGAESLRKRVVKCGFEAFYITFQIQCGNTYPIIPATV